MRRLLLAVFSLVSLAFYGVYCSSEDSAHFLMRHFTITAQLISEQHNHALRLLPDGRGDRWVVITSINYPTPSVKHLATMYPTWRTVVVGDTKTPPDWSWPNVTFLSVEDQDKLGYRISKYIPHRHYGSKNLGYIYAVAHGAKVIYETDDDNLLVTQHLDEAFNLEPGPQHMEVAHTTALAVNPYHIFGQPTVWPRGYPLGLIGEPDNYTLEPRQVLPSIQQGLANGDPDVDAIFRLTHPHPLDITFTDRDPVAIPPHVYTPFNSQNTLFHQEALWGMMIPVTTTFRVCDIWRGYFTQRLLFDMGGSLVFTKPSVVQRRNAHDYLEDFKDEEDLYEDSLALLNFLSQWRPSTPSATLQEKVVELSQAMAQEGFWGQDDANMAKAWVDDLIEAGYIFTSRTATLPTPPSLVNPKQMKADSLGVREGAMTLHQQQKEVPAFKALMEKELMMQSEVELPWYLKEAISLRDLPSIKPGVTPFMQVKNDKDLLLVDMEGPGCLNRLWFYLDDQPDPVLTIRLDEHVAWSGKTKDLFMAPGRDGSNRGHLPDLPFFRFFNDMTGMDMVFPFCFKHSAQMSVKWEGMDGLDLQATSDCIRDAAPCQPFLYMDVAGQRREEVPAPFSLEHLIMPPLEDATWEQYLSFPQTLQRIKAEDGGETISPPATAINPGESLEVFHYKGSGSIRAITMTVPVSDWDSLHWEMTWDDAPEPQVQVPFNRMYNSWTVGDTAFRGYHLGAHEQDGQVHAYLLYPMPFTHTAVGRVINRGPTPATLNAATILHQMDRSPSPEYLPGSTSGYYHAKWVNKPWGPCFNELLSLQGQAGQVMAHSWRLHGSRLQWVENDPVVYIDDSLAPKLWYSGMEDEVGGAHGFHFHREFSGPFYGWHYHFVENDYSQNKIGAYINAFGDSHRFMKSYIYGIQGHNRDGERNLDYTFHWYARANPLLTLTDEIDVGDEGSRSSHQYSPDQLSQPLVELSSAVNGRWYYYVSGFSPAKLATHTTHDCPEAHKEAITRKGMVISEGNVSFTVAVDQNNAGVVLRRLTDLYYTPQRARVYIDGEDAGVWLQSDHGTDYAPQRFADNNDFYVPLGISKGKASLHVRIEIEPREASHWTSSRRDFQINQGFAWTAFHYWIYSITP